MTSSWRLHWCFLLPTRKWQAVENPVKTKAGSEDVLRNPTSCGKKWYQNYKIPFPKLSPFGNPGFATTGCCQKTAHVAPWKQLVMVSWSPNVLNQEWQFQVEKVLIPSHPCFGPRKRTKCIFARRIEASLEGLGKTNQKQNGNHHLESKYIWTFACHDWLWLTWHDQHVFLEIVSTALTERTWFFTTWIFHDLDHSFWLFTWICFCTLAIKTLCQW